MCVRTQFPRGCLLNTVCITQYVVMFQVDLQCKIPGSGACYYPEHLPIAGTSQINCGSRLPVVMLCTRKWRGWAGLAGEQLPTTEHVIPSLRPYTAGSWGCVLLMEDTYTS